MVILPDLYIKDKFITCFIPDGIEPVSTLSLFPLRVDPGFPLRVISFDDGL